MTAPKKAYLTEDQFSEVGTEDLDDNDTVYVYRYAGRYKVIKKTVLVRQLKKTKEEVTK